ncbi:MAG: NAD(P)H-dependent oxidoreductase subunit E [SAR324 cluster bacterium]|jgi:formate dehydrogenase|nr:NAD(P)H-dependent oxidoreductase subunit E [SAR324 cluster bacterium]MDP7045852.1 NAD(P)H-dependent oxidoreductase subunit E [SAR324 cluster bacterium]MEC7886653.1 NAD(P)H-dependent oxidoreductase subunit E [SAR324 cluster bacterium]MEC9384050.1 NAD(P)H-dependent oxidoreductase subunit E [SAR324 cluster bacterium]MED5435916.1 NAD(P)H-dependent oxidoreductase subunit E [SAR324 cluster bacterium]
MNKKKLGKQKGRILDSSALLEVQKLLSDMPRRKDLLIEALHLIQDEYHFISAKHVVALAFEMKLSHAEVYEVATFYHHFDVIKEDQIPPPPLTVRVCESLSCEMSGANKLTKTLKQLFPDNSVLSEQIRIQAVPCVGRCQHAPVAVVGKNPVDQATPELVKKHVEKNAVLPTLPEYVNFAEYQQSGGYQLFQDCLTGKRDAESVISELKKSGLRGLGGAGFPVGSKWEIVSKFPEPRLMAVNIDEGEPGTFKDRYYLESDPHRFLEGSMIAAWAVGIEEIYIYLRDEYAAAREILLREIAELQSAFPERLPQFDLRRGAGAYICGEESAMIESIEGKRGIPRLRPPYVAEVGLFGRPTLEHNMETLHWVRDIIEKGAESFSSHGRRGRKGLRAFSISGRVNNPGVHLAPAGISMRELIDEYCGGMLPGHSFYGYFPGGASGGMLPASLGDLPLDFDTLQEHGCFIGSAAVIVFSEHDNARELALNAIRFFAHESCGQCTPCRVGTIKAIPLMEQKNWNQSLLEELSQTMEDASICGLGQAAPNPLRCVMKYFPKEV